MDMQASLKDFEPMILEAYCAESLDEVKRQVYKYNDCGPEIEFLDTIENGPCIRVSAIVEGYCAEFTATEMWFFQHDDVTPKTIKSYVDEAIQWLEDEIDRFLNENDAEESSHDVFRNR